jgi:hypothetical protein
MGTSNPALFHYIRNNYEKIQNLGYLCRKLQIQFAHRVLRIVNT